MTEGLSARPWHGRRSLASLMNLTLNRPHKLDADLDIRTRARPITVCLRKYPRLRFDRQLFVSSTRSLGAGFHGATRVLRFPPPERALLLGSQSHHPEIPSESAPAHDRPQGRRAPARPVQHPQRVLDVVGPQHPTAGSCDEPSCPRARRAPAPSPPEDRRARHRRRPVHVLAPANEGFARYRDRIERSAGLVLLEWRTARGPVDEAPQEVARARSRDPRPRRANAAPTIRKPRSRAKAGAAGACGPARARVPVPAPREHANPTRRARPARRALPAAPPRRSATARASSVRHSPRQTPRLAARLAARFSICDPTRSPVGPQSEQPARLAWDHRESFANEESEAVFGGDLRGRLRDQRSVSTSRDSTRRVHRSRR